MKTFKTRHQFYLPDDLTEALDKLAGKPGASKTAVLTDALRAWLDRRAGNELDQRFGPRLDRQNRTSDRIETKLNSVSAILDLFVAHQLTITAHQPPFDDVTGQLGMKRYRQFMDQVSRQLQAKRGDETLAPVELKR
ncbi:CopG family transcriptional regulator [Sphingomonas sp. So64.6b]|uniref:ribbon-helix-helix domain-containing protein n=1 Tax=Sphingomonas sp. So64.6b TaxID=2997354 RepID=UPI001602A3B3|nr:ribbon-helix-helix domain-containing protein [Sphingomonas sp. So64.6b]QNA82954.1 CopG family transcriptional regulator [Sphingomonas sp. So64.6b]